MSSRTLLAVAAALACVTLAAPAFSQGRGRGSGAGVAQPPPPPGDAGNGRALVDGNTCLSCHRIDERGSRFGPDLSAIGASRSPEQLARALVVPDDEVLPEHREIRVITNAGATVTGRLLNQDAFSVQLIDEKDELKSFQRSTLREATILQKGLMPSYEGKLTGQQINDIVNYLASLKGSVQ